MKKILALAVSVIMMLTLFAACQPQETPSGDNSAEPTVAPTEAPAGEATEAPAGEEPVETGRPTEPTGRLVVGGNAINADMFSGWTNLVSNANIKDLINGGGTIAYTADDKFVVNTTVVKDFQTIDNEDGSKTYQFELNQGLVFNDNTPITAKHYVFSLLFDCSPELVELENDRATGMDIYTGFEPYHNGETRTFSGVRLLGDYSFSVTVGAENFPFWYALGQYANVGPLPMHILAPGCDVEDTGEGATLVGDYTADLLRSTLDDGTNGFRYNPNVTCGPYNFVSYDPSSTTATLEVNPLYAGDENGNKPMIKTIIIKLVSDDTALDELSTGSVDLLCQFSGGKKINAGLDLVDEGKAEYSTYARNGYGKITFHCDIGPTQFAEVRRALAYCMDREEFVRQYTGGYGVIVHSRIGNAQWMYQENKDLLEDKLTVYTLNVDKAKEELVNGGWIYNSDGSAYVEGNGIRHKKLEDGSYMPLVIEWFSPNMNDVGEMLNTFLMANAESIGFKLNQTFGDTTAFGDAMYNTGEKKYNMINGGSGFSVLDSPWYYYDPNLPVQYNTNGIDDEVLYNATQEMSKTESGDNDKFATNWIDFVVRFNEILPDIPLYSDEYHDFYNPKLKDYNPTALWPWQYAITNAYVAE